MNFSFWAVAILLSMSMTAASLVLSQLDEEDRRHVTSVSMSVVVLLVLVAAIIATGLIFAPVVFLVIVTGLIILGLVVALITVFSFSRASSTGHWAAISVVGLAVAGSVILLVMFDRPSPDDPGRAGLLDLTTITGFILGIMALVVSWPEHRFRRAAVATLLVMIALAVLSFAVWENAGIPLVLAKSAAVVLTALVAYVLARYMRRHTVDTDQIPCRRCMQSNHSLARVCQSCGLPTN